MEQEITTLLAPVATRRYWGRAPQTPPPARPYIVLSRVSAVQGYHNQGPDGVQAVRLQIDCYADSYTEASIIGSAAEQALSGYRGGAIQAVFIDSRRDLTGIDGSDPNELYRQSIDVMVHHTSA